MQEVKLYEDLLKINDSKLEISLKSNPSRITINSWGNMEGKILWEILKKVEKHKARLILTSYGILEIKFKGDI